MFTRWRTRHRLLREALVLERQARSLRRYAITFRVTDRLSPTGTISSLQLARAVQAEEEANAVRQSRAAFLEARAAELRRQAG